MLSSAVWLYLLGIGKINPDHAPWKIYLPIVFIECFIYMLCLPKIADLIDRLRGYK